MMTEEEKDAIAVEVLSRFLEIPPQLDQFFRPEGGGNYLYDLTYVLRPEAMSAYVRLQMTLYAKTLELVFIDGPGNTLFRMVLRRPERKEV